MLGTDTAYYPHPVLIHDHLADSPFLLLSLSFSPSIRLRFSPAHDMADLSDPKIDEGKAICALQAGSPGP